MAEKVVALFVEGQTELEFYKAVVIEARALMGTQYECNVEYVNVKGIGNFKKDAVRHFDRLLRKYPGKEIYLYLCIDNDVFEFSKKPPFDKKALARELKQHGAKNVEYIIADKSIEDWFLLDLRGVLDYLKLPSTTKIPKGTGQQALKTLFKRANRVYVKGGRTEGFIDKLNIATILRKCCSSLKPLCESLSLDCKTVCEK